MLLRDFPSLIAGRFPTLPIDDTKQELAVTIWANRKARGLAYDEQIEVDDDEFSILWRVCWDRCLDLYTFMVAQKRDPRRVSRLEKGDRGVRSEAFDWAVMGELRAALFQECRINPAFLQALIDGDSELTRHTNALVGRYQAEGKLRQIQPTRILTTALSSRFNMHQRTVHRSRREVERALLAVI